MMSLVVLIIELGPSALAGFVLLAGLIFCQKRISKRIGANRRRMAKATDKRISLMSEILQGERFGSTVVMIIVFDLIVVSIRFICLLLTSITHWR